MNKQTSQLHDHLECAQYAQKIIDKNVSALVSLLRHKKGSIVHEIVNQAVINGESLEWILDEMGAWEQYTDDLLKN
jgi:putative heme iron utilization protein